MGRPRAFDARSLRQLKNVVQKLWEKSRGQTEVTAAKIYAAWKSPKKCSLCTIRRALNKKLLLTWRPPAHAADIAEQDIPKRRQFCRKIINMPPQKWKSLCWMDCHSWKKFSIGYYI